MGRRSLRDRVARAADPPPDHHSRSCRLPVADFHHRVVNQVAETSLGGTSDRQAECTLCIMPDDEDHRSHEVSVCQVGEAIEADPRDLLLYSS